MGGGLGLGEIGQVAAADLTGESPTNGEKQNKRKKCKQNLIFTYV